MGRCTSNLLFPNGSGRLTSSYCQTSSRERCGHKVWDVIVDSGNKVTIDASGTEDPGSSRYGDVEVIMDGVVYKGQWEYDRQGRLSYLHRWEWDGLSVSDPVTIHSYPLTGVPEWVIILK